MAASATTAQSPSSPVALARPHSAPDGPASGPPAAARLLTGAIVVGPVVALGVGIPLLWGQLITARDVVVAVALYLVAGFGVTIGYHRLFAHRAFTANRWLKILLAAAGSMAVEGSVNGWVAAHRRHHRFSDRIGDPHSPHVVDQGVGAQLRGLVHAHIGWLFTGGATSQERFAPDLVADRDLVRMSRLWGVIAVGSLVVPFVLGWLLSGTVAGGLTMFLWAGLARMLLLHHVTWSVNSICHTWGRRPFRTKDRSTNLAALSVLSFGDSFHNLHHAYPASARHGALPRQLDSSARLIRWMELVGWVSGVRWPDAEHVASLRRPDSAGP